MSTMLVATKVRKIALTHKLQIDSPELHDLRTSGLLSASPQNFSMAYKC